MLELRQALEPELGRQEQLDRRRRDLNPYFVVETSRRGKETLYRLAARKPATDSEDLGISESMRARVLQFGRCAMCGRSVDQHGVVLQVDHKMPRQWGGSDGLENLQALCEECNRGKKAHFATLDDLGPQIRLASAHEEPHRRIGEILKAVYPGEIRSDIVEMVAHQHQYQEDWQKRMRELRELGWVIAYRREKDETGRVRTFYRATKWTEWPPGNIRAEISRREREKKRRPVIG
jgi:5-methylcytosine-specific restriction endonuclease McrA